MYHASSTSGEDTKASTEKEGNITLRAKIKRRKMLQGKMARDCRSKTCKSGGNVTQDGDK
jgi:hypothetical protein